MILLPDWFPRDAHSVPELTGEMHNAIVGFLASTPSKLMLLNQLKLYSEKDPTNGYPLISIECKRFGNVIRRSRGV